jgi:hypothetical protein
MKNSRHVFFSPSYSRRFYAIAAFAMIGIAIACSPALVVPTAADATASHVPLETLSKGRDLYAAKCGSCHTLHTPQRRTEAEWVSAMDVMWKKAKLNDEEKGTIMKFLSTYSKK